MSSCPKVIFCVLTVIPPSIFCLFLFSRVGNVLVRHQKTPEEKKPLPFSSMAINANWRVCWVFRLPSVWLQQIWLHQILFLRRLYSSDYSKSDYINSDYIKSCCSLLFTSVRYSVYIKSWLLKREKKKLQPDCLLLHFGGFFIFSFSSFVVILKNVVFQLSWLHIKSPSSLSPWQTMWSSWGLSSKLPA